MGATSKWFFVSGLPNGSLEILTTKIPTTLDAHNFLCKPPMQCGLKQSYSPHSKFSNGMSHAACTQGNRVDSQLLVVGSQTANLTPSLSFGHNLCFKCPNGWYKPILEIYTSRRWVLTPVITFWRFKSPFGTPTPNMGIHLGVWGFIPSHSLHSREHVKWLPGLPLGPQPYNPLPWLQAQG
jgi:hypothetical protein